MKFLLPFLFLSSTIVISQGLNEQKIDSICSDWDSSNKPGGIMGVIQNGEFIFSKGYGLANVSDNISINQNTKFYLASTSKQFTAACIVQLIQQKKLSFDSKLSEFFPNFPDYASKITIQHLLNHTSGLRGYVGLSWNKNHIENWLDSYTDEDVIELLQRQKSIKFEPGEKYDYSNTNYFLLARIVEKVTELSFSDYAHKSIFDPLKMSNTVIYDSLDMIIKNRAVSYVFGENGECRSLEHAHVQTGATGIFMSINDFLKWDNEYYNRAFFNDEFWDLMTKKGVLNNGDTLIYASGLEIDTYKGLNTIHHAGALAGYRSHMLRFPDQKLTIIAFGNHAFSDPVSKAHRVADLFLSDLYTSEIKSQKPQIAVIPEDITLIELRKFEGNYWCKEKGRFVNFKIVRDTMYYQDFGKPWPLIFVGDNKLAFKEDVETINFSFETNQNPTFEWTQYFPNGTIRVLHGEKLGSDTLSLEDLSDYKGHYYCEELGVFYEFRIEKDELKLYVNGRKSSLFEVIARDKFHESNSLFNISRNMNNLVVGFTIETYDNYQLVFEKIPL